MGKSITLTTVASNTKGQKRCVYLDHALPTKKSATQKKLRHLAAHCRIRKKTPRLRLRLSPPTLQQLADELPTDLPIWHQLRKVLLNGKLRSVNPYDLTSINARHLFGQGRLDVPRLERHAAFKGNNAVSTQEVTQLALGDMLSKGSEEVGTGVGLDRRFRAFNVASKLVLFATSPQDPHDGKPLWHIDLPRVQARIPSPTKEFHGRDDLWEIEGNEANCFPFGCVADLHHDIGYGPSTLAQGEKLWILYPSTEHNLAVLRDVYHARSKPSDAYRILKFHRKFEDGVAFVQPAGTTMWVPSHCPHAVFTLKSNIMLFGTDIFAKSKLPQRMRNMDLDLALFQSKTALDQEIETVLRHLTDVLTTDDAELHKETLEAWECFNSLRMRKAIKGSSYTMDDFKEVWNTHAAHWKTCPLCNTSSNGQENQGWKCRYLAPWFKRHFGEVHCKQ